MKKPEMLMILPLNIAHRIHKYILIKVVNNFLFRNYFNVITVKLRSYKLI